MDKIILNNTYSEFKDFAENIRHYFKNTGYFIKQKRNQIKIIEINNTRLCIKRFGRPTLANILIYSFFRKSKAERSYLCAQRFTNMGIHTPAPVAYIEEYNRFRIMTTCYYVSLYEEAMFTMNDVLNTPVPNKKEIIKQFVAFVIDKLHNQGVYHRDFNGGNTMVSIDDKGKYRFSLVDLNRVQFNKIMHRKKALRHLKKLSSNPKALTRIAKYYARFEHENPNDTALELIAIKYQTLKKQRYTKKVLHKLKHLSRMPFSTAKNQ